MRTLLILLGATLATGARAEEPTAPEPVPVEAAPAEETRAKEIFENGVALYEEGNYEAAIVAFEEAYALSGRHALLYNVANAYERWGKLREAAATLDRYRVYARPDERSAVERRIVKLEERLAAEAQAASEIAVVAALPPVAPTVAPVVESPRRQTASWVAVALGTGTAAAFGTAAAVTWVDGRDASEAGDQTRWDALRPLNNASVVLGGVGAGVAVVGLATTF